MTRKKIKRMDAYTYIIDNSNSKQTMEIALYEIIT